LAFAPQAVSAPPPPLPPHVQVGGVARQHIHVQVPVGGEAGGVAWRQTRCAAAARSSRLTPRWPSAGSCGYTTASARAHGRQGGKGNGARRSGSCPIGSRHPPARWRSGCGTPGPAATSPLGTGSALAGRATHASETTSMRPAYTGTHLNQVHVRLPPHGAQRHARVVDDTLRSDARAPVRMLHTPPHPTSTPAPPRPPTWLMR
jgi:hypothetical protein